MNPVRIKKKVERVYISFPLSEPIDILNKIHSTLIKGIKLHTNKIFAVTNWIRGTNYDPSLLDVADKVVFYLPNGSFSSPRKQLSSGCFKELKRAEELGKLIYIAYETMEGEMRFYSVKNSVTNIEGISGTYLNIYNLDVYETVDSNYNHFNPCTEIICTIEDSLPEFYRNIVLLIK